ncbi:hypothetical protein [Enterobacter cloacae]|uniref:hypothetical protein n=1 Tax=Enterobacter cloacae TaxID=550 RepID=UPI000B8DA0DE|nr:hypothetical protein [Enterobacter cloacae]ASQ15719.1 hypothetical protein BJM06_a00073 [Enterobacter cloacae]
MDNKQELTLNYEQLTYIAEMEIKRCLLDPESSLYPWELTKAWAIFHYWQKLALYSHESVIDRDRVDADRKRLQTFMEKIEENDV